MPLSHLFSEAGAESAGLDPDRAADAMRAFATAINAGDFALARRMLAAFRRMGLSVAWRGRVAGHDPGRG